MWLILALLLLTPLALCYPRAPTAEKIRKRCGLTREQMRRIVTEELQRRGAR